MAQHHITLCKECGTVIGQCRCPSPNKVTNYDTCTNCKAAVFDTVTPSDKQLLREAKAREIYLRHQLSELHTQIEELEKNNER